MVDPMPKASSLVSVLCLLVVTASLAGAATLDLQLEQVLAVDRGGGGVRAEGPGWARVAGQFVSSWLQCWVRWPRPRRRDQQKLAMSTQSTAIERPC